MSFLRDLITIFVMLLFLAIVGYLIGPYLESSLGEEKAASVFAFILLAPLLLLGALTGNKEAKWILKK